MIDSFFINETHNKLSYEEVDYDDYDDYDDEYDYEI
jgi:hypothetical protein